MYRWFSIKWPVRVWRQVCGIYSRSHFGYVYRNILLNGCTANIKPLIFKIHCFYSWLISETCLFIFSLLFSLFLSLRKGVFFTFPFFGLYSYVKVVKVEHLYIFEVRQRVYGKDGFRETWKLSHDYFYVGRERNLNVNTSMTFCSLNTSRGYVT